MVKTGADGEKITPLLAPLARPPPAPLVVRHAF